VDIAAASRVATVFYLHLFVASDPGT
jgi:hypothetical protein